MPIRMFALLIGIVFLVVGVLGFIPQIVESPPLNAPDVTVHANHGYLLGLFPVNALHNAVHILFGLWGVFAFRTMGSALVFSRSLAIIYAALAVLGVFPQFYTVFGLIPIHGNDVWLHAGLAIAGAFFGWMVHPHSTGTSGHIDMPGGTPQPHM